MCFLDLFFPLFGIFVRTSFSIVYKQKLTLDLIAKHINEYHIFVEGLKTLVSLAQTQGWRYVSQLKGIHHENILLNEENESCHMPVLFYYSQS